MPSRGGPFCDPLLHRPRPTIPLSSPPFSFVIAHLPVIPREATPVEMTPEQKIKMLEDALASATKDRTNGGRNFFFSPGKG